MKSELDTLFLPFSEGSLHSDLLQSDVLFMNGRIHPYLSALNLESLDIQQVFKSDAQNLEGAGYNVIPDPCDIKEDQYDTVLLLASKSQRESENFLAHGALALKKDGLLVMAADNKAGGTRLKKMLETIGFCDIAELCKNKARVVWAKRPENLQIDICKQWLDRDVPQEIAQGFVSRAGLYGWDKIDKGSALLADSLPRDLKGKGADFGCGYGFLSKAALAKNAKIKALDYIDADYRALDVCARNLGDFDVQKCGYWMDLTAPQADLSTRYDWILMNPPFHAGKKTDSDIGQAFIKTASASLRKKGQLWMVANTHLPYESVLERCFYNFELVQQQSGFKIFCAYK